MPRLRTLVIGASAGLLFLGTTETIHALASPDTPSTEVLKQYEGLPVPGGAAVSRLTGAMLVASLYGDGHVDIAGNVRGTTVLEGTVTCNDDALRLTAETIAPTKNFHDAQEYNNTRAGDTLCDGDRVSPDALSPSALPRYVLNSVFSWSATTKGS